MSALDQPLLIANSGYHVGHLRSTQVAEEQGFFREEGLLEYDFQSGGLIPGTLEGQGLALVMKERGVDIATAVNVQSAIAQRARGAEIYIVGGWRGERGGSSLFGAKGIKGLQELRGKKIGGLRETGGITYRFIAAQLRKAGVDPDREVEWVENQAFAYGGMTSEHLDWLRSGQVDALIIGGAHAKQLAEEGYPLLAEKTVSKDDDARRPTRVIVATAKTIDSRAEELGAFLRGNIRGFWFLQNPENYPFVLDMEKRLRKATHNEDEQGNQYFARPEGTSGSAQADGQVSHAGLGSVISEMVDFGELDAPVAVEDVLRDELVRSGYEQLCARGVLG